jgi:shikimate kinase
VSDHVVLVGMMGSGKSTVGRRVAERLGRPFRDSDDDIEAQTGRTVRQIWEEEGEPAFRKLEAQALRDALASPEPSVIAAAGGTVLDPANRDAMKDAGTVVWLRGRPETLAQRVGRKDHRPLLAGDPEAVLRRLAEERMPLYGVLADVVVDIDDLSRGEVVEKVLEAVT